SPAAILSPVSRARSFKLSGMFAEATSNTPPPLSAGSPGPVSSILKETPGVPPGTSLHQVRLTTASSASTAQRWVPSPGVTSAPIQSEGGKLLSKSLAAGFTVHVDDIACHSAARFKGIFPVEVRLAGPSPLGRLWQRARERSGRRLI